MRIIICKAKCGLKLFCQAKIQRMYAPFGPTTFIKNRAIPVNPTNWKGAFPWQCQICIAPYCQSFLWALVQQYPLP